jgi:hypothetical protein
MQNQENRSMLWAAIVVLAGVALVAAYLVWRNNTPATTTDSTTPPADSSSLAEIFTLDAQNGSGQSGTVALEQVGNQVQVTISLTNPRSTAEPAHIHTGSCPSPGGVVFPLTDVVEGGSVTLINTTIAELIAQVPLAVNIHKSAAESSVYFACGNLVF